MSQNKTNNWEPCFTDPKRGVAFFDGITIESDPITSLRRDRVLPVLEEEQVFVCRQMKHLIEKKLEQQGKVLLLDIGTGSGVYAIWAAKLGCQVVAIDSERAIRIAHQNITKNNIKIIENEKGHLIGPNTVVLLRSNLMEIVEEYQDAFDFVVLSPPYTPIFPGISAPHYADGGKSGQDRFEAQMKIVPHLLKEGGYCIGNQMCFSYSHNDLSAWNVIEESFENKFSIEYTRMLREDYPVRDFLEGLYKSYLDIEREFPSKEIESYIKKIAMEGPNFALVYYEIKKDRSAHHTKRPEQFVEKDRPRSKRTWKDRVWVHGYVVEHSASRESCPAPSLFLSNPFVSDLSWGQWPQQEDTIDDQKVINDKDQTADITNSDNSKGKEEWKKSPLNAVEQWIKRTGIMKGERPKFDAIFVDTSPFYHHLGGVTELPQEVVVWVADAIAAHHEDLAEQFGKRYRATSQAMIESKTGLFFHEAMTGINAPEQWRSIHFSTLLSNENPVLEDWEKITFEDIQKRHGNEYTRFKFAREEQHKIYCFPHRCYSYVRLDALDLKTINEYRSSMDKQIQTMKSDTSYERYIESRKQEYSMAIPDQKALKREMETALVSRHFDICHLLYHDVIRQAMNDVYKENKWTALLAFPLSFTHPEPELKAINRSEPPTPPDSYRGCVWIYACSSEVWTLGHEEYLNDLSRLLWLLYESKYQFDAAESLTNLTRNDLAQAAAHEVGAPLANANYILGYLSRESDQARRQEASDLIRDLLDLARLHFVSSYSEAPDWMLQPGYSLKRWVESCKKKAWEVTIARESAAQSYDDLKACVQAKSLSGPKVTIDGIPENIIYNPSKDNEQNYVARKLTKWLIAALTNAMKWSGHGTDMIAKGGIPLLNHWGNNPYFKDIEVIFKQDNNFTSIEIYNGCFKPPSNVPKLKPYGTKEFLEFISTALSTPGLANPTVEFRSLRPKEAPHIMDGEKYRFKTSIQLDNRLFSRKGGVG